MDWGFLDHALERKRFNPRWRTWMRGCMCLTNFAVLVNGSANGWFKQSKV